MTKKLKMIPKILSSEKTIESRWYKARFAPWDRIFAGDTIYFKNSGEPVSVVAQVKKVLQFADLDRAKIEEIIAIYGDAIALRERKHGPCYAGVRYCILVFLKNARPVENPFSINKSGFGIACAWMTVEDVKAISLD